MNSKIKICAAVILSTIMLFSGCSKSENKKNSEDETVTQSTILKENSITLGNYEDQKIEWNVIDERDTKKLLITKYAISCREFDDSIDYEWNSCSLRKWLNDDFYSTCFSKEEQSIMLQSKYSESEDYIFILSQPEVKVYFPTPETRLCIGTKQCRLEGAYYDNELHCRWWMRPTEKQISFINSNGEFSTNSKDLKQVAVRPVVWVDKKNLESLLE